MLLTRTLSAQLERPHDHEDLQAIPFHCWVTSKVFKRDYYEVLLHAIKWKRGEMEKKD